MVAAGPVQQPDCVGVESRGRGAGPVPVPNLSSFYNLFNFVIYNSVGFSKAVSLQTRKFRILESNIFVKVKNYVKPF